MIRRGSSGISIKKSTDYLESNGHELIYSFDVTAYADFEVIIDWEGTHTNAYLLTDEGVTIPIANSTPTPVTFATAGNHAVWLYGVFKPDIRIVDSNNPVIASSPWALYDTDPVMSYSNFALVWFDGTTYHAYGAYDNYTKIGHATSADGLAWTNDTANNPVMTVTSGGTYDQTSVAVSLVWVESGTWYMLYRGNGNQTCLATSADGLVWTKYASNPVIPSQADPAGIIKVGSTYWLFCNTTGGNRYISVYSSTDLHTWTVQMPDPLMAGGRFCSCPFKYNGKYYLLVSKYWGPGNAGGSIELFSSYHPGFLDCEYLGRVVHHADRKSVDTPTIVTDTVYRDTFPGNKLMCYYSMLLSGIGYPLYLTVQNDIQAAIEAAIPITSLNCLLGDGRFVGSSPPALAGNRLYMQRFEALRSGEIANVKVACAKSANLKVAIYSDNANTPNALLAESVSTSVVNRIDNHIAFVSPLAVTKGTYYWIVFNQNATGVVRYTNGGGKVGRYVSFAYGDAFPATMPATTEFSVMLSVSAWIGGTAAEYVII